MKKLLVAAILAAAAAALACSGGSKSASTAAGADKKTRIVFTKNYDKGTGPGQYNTDCIGIVTSEQIFGDHKQKIKWTVSLENPEDTADKCDTITDLTTVNLRFENDVMGAAAMKKLTSNGGGEIMGEVSDSEGDYNGKKLQKYQVYIGNEKAGPDPIIVVNCGSCGPGGGGPTE